MESFWRQDDDDYRTDYDAFLRAKEEQGSTGHTVKVKAKKHLRESGPIDGFYKDNGAAEDEGDSDQIANLLKMTGLDGFVHKLPNSASGAVVASGPSAEHVRVVVLYGTEFGFSKEIAEKLCLQLKEAKTYWPVLVDMADHPTGYELSKEQAVFAVCSTQGDGVPPTEARDFCQWLFAGKAGDLSSLNFSVCALGDRTYQHFCRCGKLIDAALEKAGAKQLVDRVDVNKEDWKAVNAWLEAVVLQLGLQKLKTLGELGGVFTESASEHSAVRRFGKSRPFAATVLATQGLCNLSSTLDKNTVRVEFDLEGSGLTYLPGDALGIYPSNPAQAVAELLEVLRTKGSLAVPPPSWHYEDAAVDSTTRVMPLGQALLKAYDLRSPKPDLLQALLTLITAHLKEAVAIPTPEQAEAEGAPSAHDQEARLQALIADEALHAKYFAERHVIDVLLDFSAARMDATQLLPHLRQLQPRLYSISSSPLEHPTRVQTTVAEVKYETRGRARVGICSTHLSERCQVGSTLPVYIHKNADFRLPEDPSTPIIMVGPGTGLAPFRSFILQRLLERGASDTASEAAGPDAVTTERGQMVLFFGCRRSDQDYLYGDVLDGWAAEGRLTLFNAFSRQQAEKVYVQQRVRENGELLWKLLQQGAHFYVCGDASSMAGAVEVALLEVIAERQDLGAAAAAEYLAELSRVDRYQRDVWFS
ncbi:MAG: hypothetical protein WDW38_001692 [Sanguina aurantia]